MEKLTDRQKFILHFIQNNNDVSTKEILIEVNMQSEKNLRRLTIIRDLDILLQHGYIFRFGQGRGVIYSPNLWLKYIDVLEYYKKLPEERKIIKSFNFDVLNNVNLLFSEDEISKLTKLNSDKQEHIQTLSPTIQKKEMERLIIDLSWKSSYIEGNTYNLLETEYLIKERKEAAGHTKEEAIMIMNHKEALDYIIRNKNDFKEINVKKIEDIHFLLTKDLGIGRNIRKSLVGIGGTNYIPLDNEYQIKEALEKTCALVNARKNPLTKSLILNLLIAYIQPFEDGNKRTARIMGNTVLLANNYYPLSFRSIDEQEYKKAVLLFYEQNSALYFKELFIEQFKFAVDNYFL